MLYFADILQFTFVCVVYNLIAHIDISSKHEVPNGPFFGNFIF